MVNLLDGDWLTTELDDEEAVVCARLVTDASSNQVLSSVEVTAAAVEDDCLVGLCQFQQQGFGGGVHVCRSLTSG